MKVAKVHWSLRKAPRRVERATRRKSPDERARRGVDVDVAQAGARDLIFRIATPNFGMGLLENTPDLTLSANVAANVFEWPANSA